jgi:DNA-binding response OmpR family regulator
MLKYSLMTALKILIVDNEIEDRNKLGEGLQRSGFSVAYAATAREGMNIAITRRPDLIVTELMLPDVDGFSLLEILKRTALTSQIPVVVLSEWASSESRRTSLKSGAEKFLPKPCTASRLVSQLPASVKRRKNNPRKNTKARKAS